MTGNIKEQDDVETKCGGESELLKSRTGNPMENEGEDVKPPTLKELLEAQASPRMQSGITHHWTPEIYSYVWHRRHISSSFADKLLIAVIHPDNTAALNPSPVPLFVISKSP